MKNAFRFISELFINYPVTIAISVLCILISLYAWTTQPELIIATYGYSTNALLNGEIWVLITSIFLHSGINHLVLNIVALLVFGIVLEGEIGSRRVFFLFILGAFAGALLSSLFYPSDTSFVGASAGIFSVMTATLLIKPVWIESYIPIPIGVIAFGYILTMVSGLITGQPADVSHIGHLGGAFVGLFYGFLVRDSKDALKVLIGVFIIFLFILSIWNFWVLLVNILTSFL